LFEYQETIISNGGFKVENITKMENATDWISENRTGVLPQAIRERNEIFIIPLQHLFDELGNHEIRFWTFDSKIEMVKRVMQMRKAAKAGRYNILVRTRLFIVNGEKGFGVEIEKAGIKNDF